MKISASSTFFLTVCGLASSTASNIWQRTYNALDVLIPRQTSGTGVDPSQIPTQCQTQCTTVLNTISTCTTDSCICTTDNANEMESCVNCLISLDPTEDMIEEGNEILSCECRLELYRSSLFFFPLFLPISFHTYTDHNHLRMFPESPQRRMCHRLWISYPQFHLCFYHRIG
ncbi:hypothetical protein DFH05DRAFT_475029 [Lentinula detonsa]|uniref:Extracellular membrane protein CFEM domain-containing protein n=1 Tax=Lentinula detonsa TaxID=2804962 RepID=A0A9W8NSH3_9AGAR|nr:hypothetical protein DFH05DRAFT_475029 [Lentinula detonsa]